MVGRWGGRVEDREWMKMVESIEKKCEEMMNIGIEKGNRLRDWNWWIRVDRKVDKRIEGKIVIWRIKEDGVERLKRSIVNKGKDKEIEERIDDIVSIGIECDDIGKMSLRKGIDDG